MLDSLERSPLPTRAEVTDVFFAAENGTDATMLSGETAQGQYPVEAISVMGNILTKAEQAFNYVRGMTKMFVKSPLAKTPEGKQAIAIADAVIGKYIQEPVYTTITPMQLILFSNNPKLIQALSSIRSFRAIIVITDKEEIHKGFGLNYGIFTYKIDSINLSSEEREAVFKELKKKLPDNSDAIYLE
jgi:pyruvate kinase